MDNVSDTARHLFRSSLFLPMLGAVLLTTALVSPVGNFPLIDDQFYADNVRLLLVEHSLVKTTKAPVLAQTLWGTAFTIIFGKSYSVLRLSTLLLAVVSLWLTARLAAESGIRRGGALLCGVVVLANPLFLTLSYTYMTEIPFIASSVACGLFYARALGGGRDRDLLVGSLFAVLATSIRHFGAALPLSCLLTAAVLRAAGERRWSIRQIAAFLLPLIAALLAWMLFSGFGRSTRHPLAYLKPTLKEILIVTSSTGFHALIYLGLFLLPLGAGILLSAVIRGDLWSRRQWLALPVLSLILFLGSTNYNGEGFLASRRMPLVGPTLYDLGVGPLTLRDTWFFKMGNPVSIGDWWWVITVLSTVSFAALAVHFLFPFTADFRDRIRRRGEGDAGGDSLFGRRLFLLLWGAILLMAPYNTIVGYAIDRYFLPALPPLAILAASFFFQNNSSQKPGRVAAWSICALFYLFSLACIQDYMAWNTARWEGIRHLRHDLKVPDWKIDGGLEFNALFTRDQYRALAGNKPFDWGPKGFYVIDDSYALSFHPRKGMRVMKRIPYYSWLGMEERTMLVLTRRGAGAPE